MNTRLFTFTFAAFALCALGACSSESTGSTTTTGSGGSGSGGGTTGTGTGGSGGSGGAAACDAAYTCAEALDGDPTKLCDGEHGDLYDKYFACTCETGGACFSVCEKANCAGTPSDECTKCIQATTDGCASVFEACSADI